MKSRDTKPNDDDALQVTPNELESYFDEVLVHIDRELADRDVPLSGRTLQAVIIFVKNFVKDVSDSSPTFNRERIADHLDALWFQVIYAGVENWYRSRFGAALERISTGMNR